MPTYLTETTRIVDGQPRPWCGPNIEAFDKFEAQVICAERGLKYCGELIVEFDAGIGIGEMIRRLREVDAPEKLISDVIDIERQKNKETT